MLKFWDDYLWFTKPNFMKQITFSNVVAVAAIVLCLYAFAGDKKSSGTVEMEYCMMKFYPMGYTKAIVGANLMYSDGKFEHDTTLLPDDPTGLKTINVQISRLSADGWLLKQYSSVGNTEVYIFERVK